jgi:hypothetical protein
MIDIAEIDVSYIGQGVYTITNKQELSDFMAKDHHYDKFIVQSLVGNASWSSITRAGKFYHVGTIPNKKNHTFVSDLRMMVTANKGGFRPVAIYARRARKPLVRNLSDSPNSKNPVLYLLLFAIYTNLFMFSYVMGNVRNKFIRQTGRRMDNRSSASPANGP